MKIGVVVAQDFWIHFQEIYKYLQTRHILTVFKVHKWPFQLMSSRINNALLDIELGHFMSVNDLVFFEWGEDFFVRTTHLKKSSKIMARLHLHEVWDYADRADWSQVDRVIFVSEAMRRKFLERIPVAAGRAEMVHNGVRIDIFKPRERNFQGILGTLGRIEPHKRIYDLILILEELRKLGFDLKLRIGGSCTESRYQRYADEVTLLVRRTGMEDFVQFDGHVNNTSDWYKNIDIFISHSVSEGLQVALLEAMASGCYCLAHAWDGVSEVLPGENIYFNENELINKIKEYITKIESEKQEEQEKLRNVAVDRFDIEKQKTRVVDIIEEVLNN